MADEMEQYRERIERRRENRRAKNKRRLPPSAPGIGWNLVADVVMFAVLMTALYFMR